MASLTDPRLALTIPAHEIESEALDQIKKVLDLDYLKRLAVMPDVHCGYDLPIGGVALLDGYISPAFVGYDIGCGMCHVNTGHSLSHFGLDTRKTRDMLLEKLREEIPVGFAVHTKRPFGCTGFQCFAGNKELGDKVNAIAGVQMGTLGGGNHFLEFGVNKAGELGLTVHSGSRRPGWEIANYYMRKARMLRADSDMGYAYLRDMDWALHFGINNRLHLLYTALDLLFGNQNGRQLTADPNNLINSVHNEAIVMEQGVLHRKGSIPAELGRRGIIPANQRDGVYIVEGLGNEDFLCSASHGAGRSMSRSKAKKKLDLEGFQSEMQEISCRADESTLDEAAGAYKDIGQVLSAQEGVLVKIVDHFRPVIVLKG